MRAYSIRYSTVIIEVANPRTVHTLTILRNLQNFLNSQTPLAGPFTQFQRWIPPVPQITTTLQMAHKTPFFFKKISCPLSKSSCGHEFWRPLFWVSGVQKTTETNSIVHGQLAIVQRFKKMCHFVEPRSVPENLTTDSPSMGTELPYANAVTSWRPFVNPTFEYSLLIWKNF